MCLWHLENVILVFYIQKNYMWNNELYYIYFLYISIKNWRKCNIKYKLSLRKRFNMEFSEDKVINGEFIPSYFAWLTLEKQKEVADKLSNMTNK